MAKKSKAAPQPEGSGTVEFGRSKGTAATGAAKGAGPRGKRRRDPHAVRKTKAKDRPQVVEYDDGARQAYLTGFHKRKVEKQKAGALRRAAAEREEAREARRKRARPLSLVQEELERIEALNQEIREAAAAGRGGRRGGADAAVASTTKAASTTTTTTTIHHEAGSGQASIVTITPLEL